jgi:hypothetical protein
MCQDCCFYYYDEDYEAYVCDINLDEDEYSKFLSGSFKECPYFRSGDEYEIARKQ